MTEHTNDLDALEARWRGTGNLGFHALEVLALIAEVRELRAKVADAWDEGAQAMKVARLVQGESLPANPYRAVLAGEV